jgi:hypothetical protein
MIDDTPPTVRLACRQDARLPDPWRDFAAAVVLRAIRDAVNGDTEACAWLASEYATDWLEMVDIEQDDVAKALPRLSARWLR